MAEIRDRVIVESERVGERPRTGVVTAVHGRMITIQWDTGGESSLIPQAGSLRVEGSRAKKKGSK